jgi:hypothetical protein
VTLTKRRTTHRASRCRLRHGHRAKRRRRRCRRLRRACGVVVRAGACQRGEAIGRVSSGQSGQSALRSAEAARGVGTRTCAARRRRRRGPRGLRARRDVRPSKAAPKRERRARGSGAARARHSLAPPASAAAAAAPSPSRAVRQGTATRPRGCERSCGSRLSRAPALRPRQAGACHTLRERDARLDGPSCAF